VQPKDKPLFRFIPIPVMLSL